LLLSVAGDRRKKAEPAIDRAAVAGRARKKAWTLGYSKLEQFLADLRRPALPGSLPDLLAPVRVWPGRAA